tara:strand:- start:177 stop:518 length:342 start_codon:yes stop_codon:yes gene_type:complete
MNTVDTLSIILSYRKANLAKVASTCKKWKAINSEYNDAVKMNFLLDTSYQTRAEVFLELDKEMFNVSKAFVSSYDDYNSDWRDAENEDEHQYNWYAWREYSFFYEQTMAQAAA